RFALLSRSRCIVSVFSSVTPRPLRATLFPYTTLFRSVGEDEEFYAPPGFKVSLESSASPVSDAHKGSAATTPGWGTPSGRRRLRSEEHTSELQTRFDLVCRLLLEKKNKTTKTTQ